MKSFRCRGIPFCAVCAWKRPWTQQISCKVFGKSFTFCDARENLTERPARPESMCSARSASRYNAVMALQGNGFTNVYNVSGGFLGFCYHEYFNDVTQNREPIVTNYLSNLCTPSFARIRPCTVRVWACFPAGPVYETAQTLGISHLVEHLFFRLLPGLPQKQLYSDLAKLGATLRGKTGPRFHGAFADRFSRGICRRRVHFS